MTSPWGIEDYDVEAYLERLGLDSSRILADARRNGPSLRLAGDLHEAHVSTLPFSNVQVLLGDHPGVDSATVQRQLVRDARGGYCFEHSQLYAGVLERLGFRVERALGRVGGRESPRTHLTVLVTIDGERFFADPGFGFSLRRLMPYADGAVHREGDREFSLVRDASGPVEVWEFLRDGELQHVHDALPPVPADVAIGHAATSTGVAGPFTAALMAMRHTGEDEHVTVTHEARTVRTAGRPTVRESLDPAATVAAVEDLGVWLTGAEERRRLVEIVEDLQHRNG